jgi:release factor glutamine methyltransferase
MLRINYRLTVITGKNLATSERGARDRFQMNIFDALYSIKSQLLSVSGEFALSDAERILMQILQFSRSDLYLSSKESISKEKLDEINVIVERRKHHEPLPYIFNTAYFHSMEIFVDRSVLIPRPDTEILVETILKSEKQPDCFFLDMGIGSGAISAILAKENPHWKGIGADISQAALCIAKKNCPDTISLLNADALSAFKTARFDFIVSNPPYVSAKEMKELDESVSRFEPAVALLGGEDGLKFYRILAENAKEHLKAGGRLYCEIGNTQKDAVTELLAAGCWKDIRVMNDLAGRPRVCVCKA